MTAVEEQLKQKLHELKRVNEVVTRPALTTTTTRQTVL